jgi:hypothetical protein
MFADAGLPYERFGITFQGWIGEQLWPFPPKVLLQALSHPPGRKRFPRKVRWTNILATAAIGACLHIKELLPGKLRDPVNSKGFRIFEIRYRIKRAFRFEGTEKNI